MKTIFEKEIVRFAIVGILSAVFNYSTNFTLISSDFSPQFSSGCGYLTGILVGFPLNKLWSFQSAKKFDIQEFLKYIALYLFTFFVNIWLSGESYHLFHDVISHELGAKLLYYFPVIVITTVINFMGCKLLVFKQSDQSVVVN